MNDPENFEWVRTMAAKFVDEHVPILISKLKWQRFDNILDYGCGSGLVASRFIFPLAEKYFSAVTGVDVSPEMIKYAQKKYPNPRATFIVGNIMEDDPGSTKVNWPLGKKKFDKIFGIHVLIYIEDYKEFFNRLYNQLIEEGGQMAFAIPYGKFYRIHHDLSNHPKWGQYLGETKNKRASWPHDETLDLPKEIETILNCLGMEILDFFNYKTSFAFRNVDGFVDFIMATNIGVQKVPLDLKEELRQEIGVRGAALNQIPVSSQPFTIQLNYLRFVAQK